MRRHKFPFKDSTGTTANVNFSISDSKPPEVDDNIVFKGRHRLRVHESNISRSSSLDNTHEREREYEHEGGHNKKDYGKKHHDDESSLSLDDSEECEGRPSNSNNQGHSLDQDYPTNHDNKTLAINLEDIKSRLDDLLLQANVPPETLTGKSLEDLKVLIQYMQKLHGTTSYNVYLDEIRKRFSNINIIPGTVGAYFGGCLKTPENPCSVTCAGSISPDDKTCPATVFYLTASPKGRILKLLQLSPNNKTGLQSGVIVYIDSAIQNFTDFTPDELNKLKFYGFNNSAKVYMLSNGKTVDISSKIHNSNFFEKNNIVIGIVIVVIIIVILYLVLRRKNT